MAENKDEDPSDEAQRQAVLDSICFQSHYRKPDLRIFSFSSGSTESIDDIKSRALKPDTEESIKHDLELFRRHFSPEESERHEAALRRQIAFAKRLKESVTPDWQEVINQQRLLATKYCELTNDLMLVLNISKEEAAIEGISPDAYDNFEEWVNKMNSYMKKSSAKEQNGRCIYYYQLYFNDNADDKSKDIIILNEHEVVK